MPELPEVENVRRSLKTKLLGKRFYLIEPFHQDVWQNPGHLDINGQILLEIDRKGKYLHFIFTNNLHLLAHLRMTGRFSIVSPDIDALPHTHVRFKIVDDTINDEDNLELRYSDPRRFGRLTLYSKAKFDELSSGIKSLGLEPIDPNFDAAYLINQQAKHPRMLIKAFLLNQSIIAGLGNIYVDEILFKCRIHPATLAGSITPEKFSEIATSATRILTIAIKEKGTTFRNYRDGNGNKGNFQNFLQVYGQKDHPCPVCHHNLQAIKISGRTSVFCGYCQK